MARLGFSPRARAMVVGAALAWMMIGALQDFQGNGWQRTSAQIQA